MQPLLHKSYISLHYTTITIKQKKKTITGINLGSKVLMSFYYERSENKITFFKYRVYMLVTIFFYRSRDCAEILTL